MGGASDRDRRGHHLGRGDRGRALRRDDHRPDVPPAQADARRPAVASSGAWIRRRRTRPLIGWPTCWSSSPAGPSSRARPWSERFPRPSPPRSRSTCRAASSAPPSIPDTVVSLLEAVGAEVAVDGPALTVTPPSWRPDLHRPVRLRRRGRSAGRLRHHHPHRSAGAGRPRVDGRPARSSSRHRRGGGRRFRRGAELPVHRRRRAGQARGAGGRPTTPAQPDRQPARRDRALPADHAAPRPVRRGRPQPQSRQRRPGHRRDGFGVLRRRTGRVRPSSGGDAADRATPSSPPWTRRSATSRGTSPRC